jgi:iron complex transport system ATP-binding protein
VELKLEGICYERRGKPVLDGIDIAFPTGGLTCLLGTNGAGKTTLIRILSGELKGISGRYCIDGRDAALLSRRELSSYFSVISQNAPVPAYLSVGEMVGLGRFQPGAALRWRLTADDKAVVNECLIRCRLDSLKDRRLDELSGGEQRRVWLAFGLASQKAYLMLDETLDGMDVLAKRAFFEVLKGSASKDHTVLMASHDLEMVAEFADHVIILNCGRVTFDGPPDGDLLAAIATTPREIRRPSSAY